MVELLLNFVRGEENMFENKSREEARDEILASV